MLWSGVRYLHLTFASRRRWGRGSDPFDYELRVPMGRGLFHSPEDFTLIGFWKYRNDFNFGVVPAEKDAKPAGISLQRPARKRRDRFDLSGERFRRDAAHVL